MGKTRTRSRDIEDGSIRVSDLDTTTAGEAVVSNVQAGAELVGTSSGVDDGSGNVVISAGPNVALRNVDNFFTENQTVGRATGSSMVSIESSDNEAITRYIAGPNTWSSGADNTVNRFIISSLSGLLGAPQFIISLATNIVDVVNKRIVNLLNPIDEQDAMTRAASYHACIENIVPRINDSTVDQVYLGGDFTPTAPGSYVATTNFTYSHDSITNDIIVDFEVNGVTRRVVQHEPSDASGTGIIAENREDNINETTGTNQRYSSVKTIKLNITQAQIDGGIVIPTSLIFSTSSGGVESTIYEATIELKRLTHEGTVTAS